MNWICTLTLWKYEKDKTSPSYLLHFCSEFVLKLGFMTDSCLEKHLSINEKWSLFHMYSPTFKAVDLNDSIKILLRFYSLLCSSNPLYNLDIPAATDVQKGGRRSYPSPKVRGDRERQAVMAQERLRGATPCLRSGVVAERSYPTSKVRGGGQEEQPHVQGVASREQEGREELHHLQGQQGRPWGDTPRPR